MIRLLVADDHIVLRDGIKHLVSRTLDIKVIAEAANGDEVLTGLANNAIDLIILDLNMPGTDSMKLILLLKSQWPDLPILVFSGHREIEFAIRSIRAGVNGYLTKDSEYQILLHAIRVVAGGGQYLDPLIAGEVVFGMLHSNNPSPHGRLSRRELEVLAFIGKGNNVKEIAELLGLSNKTVSTYKMRLMEKMNIANNVDLARCALRHNLIS